MNTKENGIDDAARVKGAHHSAILGSSRPASDDGNGSVTLQYGALGQSAKLSRTSLPLSKRLRLSSPETFILSFLQLMDITMIGFTGAVIFEIYIGGETGAVSEYSVAMGFLVIIFVSLSHRFNLYDFELLTTWLKTIKRLVIVMVATLLVLIGLAFVLKVSDNYSRI